MTVSADRKIVLIVRPTRLDDLVTRFNTCLLYTSPSPRDS